MKSKIAAVSGLRTHDRPSSSNYLVKKLFNTLFILLQHTHSGILTINLIIAKKLLTAWRKRRTMLPNNEK